MSTRIPLDNAAAIRVAAERAGLPLAAACALIEKESGGRNVYGHDAGGAGPAGQPVTEANFKAFLKAVLAGATSNGVGPAQITWAGSLVNGRRDGGFFTVMQGRGLRPWVPVDNMRFGFELLAGYHAASGSWVEAGTRYNGAREYGLDLAAKVRAWQDRLEAARPDRLVVFAWNSHKSNPWANVRDALHDEVVTNRPDVIVLNEVKRHYGSLDNWAERNGYVCHQEKPLPEVAGKPVPDSGSTAVLVDSKLDILSAKVVALKQPWKVFSHNRWHTPRRGWQIRFRTDGGKWKGRFVHGPTNGFAGGNRVAFAEFAKLMASALANRATGVVAFAVGDHNEKLGTLRKWARAIGATTAGHNVDTCLAVGAGVTAEVGNLDESDHHKIRYTLTRK